MEISRSVRSQQIFVLLEAADRIGYARSESGKNANESQEFVQFVVFSVLFLECLTCIRRTRNYSQMLGISFARHIEKMSGENSIMPFQETNKSRATALTSPCFRMWNCCARSIDFYRLSSFPFIAVSVIILIFLSTSVFGARFFSPACGEAFNECSAESRWDGGEPNKVTKLIPWNLYDNFSDSICPFQRQRHVSAPASERLNATAIQNINEKVRR